MPFPPDSETERESRHDLRWLAPNLLDPTAVPIGRVFCIPHAGGTSSLFARWPSLFLPDIEVCGIDLPGRGTRFKEPFVTDMLYLASQIARVIARIADVPFAIYGECSGGLIALATTRALASEHQLVPTHLFATGMKSPRVGSGRGVYRFSDENLQREIVEKGLLDPAIASNSEAMEFFLPQIRADYELCETYESSSHDRIGCPITTIANSRDFHAAPAAFEDWRNETAVAWQHFAINFPMVARDPDKLLTSRIRQTLVGGMQ
ncbi:thioesterase II family protein [Burkholderia gladioli]|uniref:thioesterase II family protein n=1 Tax=Burkholderia gladioli TaxID=28095 RepID=UPI0016407083|nr:thioesterase [Burkholderia gladioli]